MKLQITVLQETNTVQLAGDLDLYNVEAARDALVRHLTGKGALEFDLSGVETCDASGIQLLVAARRSALALGKGFSIHPPAPALEKCRELLGLLPESLQPHQP